MFHSHFPTIRTITLYFTIVYIELFVILSNLPRQIIKAGIPFLITAAVEIYSTDERVLRAAKMNLTGGELTLNEMSLSGE